MTGSLSKQEKYLLLNTAREAISHAVNKEPQNQITLEDLPAALKIDCASFVTLTIDGGLRGCIGTMEPYQPLILDVQEHAMAAAMSDFRFSPVQVDELPLIKIEISRLTPIERLLFNSSTELIDALRIDVDGVLMRAGHRSATFLPQVWKQLPKPEEFLSHLCEKMGAAPDYWRSQPMEVYTYQVEKFCEI